MMKLQVFFISSGKPFFVWSKSPWEGSLEENGYMCMYNWVLCLSTWNYHSIVNQLYSNIKQKVLQNEFSPSTVELRNTLHVCMHAQSLQSCPTLCDPMDCCRPASSVHGILQAGILEWVAVPSSRGFPDPGFKPESPALLADSSPLSHQGSPRNSLWPSNSTLR